MMIKRENCYLILMLFCFKLLEGNVLKFIKKKEGRKEKRKEKTKKGVKKKEKGRQKERNEKEKVYIIVMVHGSFIPFHYCLATI
jgi:hypothetical protein